MNSQKNQVMMAIALLTATAALARIGESPDQCKARYGDPVKEISESRIIYVKGGILILAEFHEDKADLITFRKAEQDALGNPAKLSANEVAGLLKANGGEREWRKVEAVSLDTQWQTQNAELIADLDGLDNTLMILTKEHHARAEAKRKAAENKNLSGF